MLTNPPDELLERASNGDPEALQALLRSVQPQIYRFGLKMCRHEEDAEDVLQDTLLTIARSVKDFKGASSLSTWLYAITRSICIKRRRKSKFEPDGHASVEEGVVSDPKPTPDAELSQKQTWSVVAAAIRALPVDQREVLMLRDVEGLSAKEVAEVVGQTEAAVKSRLHRARSSLRVTLSNRPPAPSNPGCPDIHAIFSEHIEGTLDPQICSRMEHHVMICPDCASECAGLRETLSVCSSAPAEVPLEIQQRIESCLAQVLAEPTLPTKETP